MLFRYLYEFLYGWLISALTRADSFLVENDLMNDTNKQKNGNKKKPKHKKKPRPYMKDIAYYQALQNMCGGYYKVSSNYFNTRNFFKPIQIWIFIDAESCNDSFSMNQSVKISSRN